MGYYVEGAGKGDRIDDYFLLQDFDQAANGFISFASKGTEKFFIKAFAKPKYPIPGAKVSEKVRQKKLQACERFKNNYENIVKIFRNNLDPKKGQLIFPVEFRRMKSTFLQFSPKIEIAHTSPSEVAREYDLDMKLVLLKSLVNAVNLIHINKIVHGDLKFDNVLIKKTVSKLPTTKIIDFDGSYLSESPHEPQYMHSDQTYMAPELSLYSQKSEAINEKDMTTAADIFSLGIILHEYCSGERPRVKYTEEKKINYLGDAVNLGMKIEINEEIIGENLSKIISEMLSKDYRKRPSAGDVFKEIKSSHIEIHQVKLPIKSEKKATKSASYFGTTSSVPSSGSKKSKLVEEPLHGLKIISKKKK